MGLLTVISLTVLISLPLEASPINSAVQINTPTPMRRYFGRPNSHFKYNFIPRSEDNEPRVSEESDSYIERLIIKAIQGPHNVERDRRSNQKPPKRVSHNIDTDYYLIFENER